MKNKDFSFYKGLTKVLVTFMLVFSIAFSLSGIVKAEEKEQEFDEMKNLVPWNNEIKDRFKMKEVSR